MVEASSSSEVASAIHANATDLNATTVPTFAPTPLPTIVGYGDADEVRSRLFIVCLTLLVLTSTLTLTLTLTLALTPDEATLSDDGLLIHSPGVDIGLCHDSA